MALEQAISMEPVKEKLKKLREYLPNMGEGIYELGEYLAERLDPELVSAGFVQRFELSLYELSNGVDKRGNPLRHPLVGYPNSFYTLLRFDLPTIANAVCPTDFAEEVKKCYEEINAELNKKD